VSWYRCASPKTAGNEKQHPKISHKPHLLILLKMYINMFIQFTNEFKNEVTVLLNCRQYGI
jgi:hypothetical protein